MSMPAFAPSPERFLLFLSARQEHHPISSQLNGDRFWRWKPNPTAVPNTHLHLCPGPCPTEGSRGWAEAFLRQAPLPHPHPSSRLREFILSPVLSCNTPQEKLGTCMQWERVCVQRNPSALRSPVPVHFLWEANSPIPLGFFFSLSVGSVVEVAQLFGGHCVLLQW